MMSFEENHKKIMDTFVISPKKNSSENYGRAHLSLNPKLAMDVDP